MADAKRSIEQFFDTYAERMNNALDDNPSVDVESVARQFADFFVEASPVGVNGGKNDAQFRAMIPRGYEFYRKIGTQSMKITDRQITPLDDFHWMVKVHWKAEYLKKTNARDMIEFDVIYFVQVLEGEAPKVFAYITGDEQRVMQEHGLIDPEAVSESVSG